MITLEQHFHLNQGSGTFLTKEPFYLPADMTGEEPKYVDAVLFFIQIHSGID